MITTNACLKVNLGNKNCNLEILNYPSIKLVRYIAFILYYLEMGKFYNIG